MSDASKTSLNFDHSLVTTAFELAGYKVTRNLGVVSPAETSRSSQTCARRRDPMPSNA
jgi:hypothetical protein